MLGLRQIYDRLVWSPVFGEAPEALSLSFGAISGASEAVSCRGVNSESPRKD